MVGGLDDTGGRPGRCWLLRWCWWEWSLHMIVVIGWFGMYSLPSIYRQLVCCFSLPV